MADGSIFPDNSTQTLQNDIKLCWDLMGFSQNLPFSKVRSIFNAYFKALRIQNVCLPLPYFIEKKHTIDLTFEKVGSG